MHKAIMISVLVTGANGQLGSELHELINYNSLSDCRFIFTDINTLDITDKILIEDFIKNNNINLILNCAAYTAVDKAETETDKATLINTIAPSYLAEAAEKNNAKLIHISTDYVFDGTSSIPYKEDDFTNPKSAYGLTKLGGESAILNLLPESIIIRTSWLYSAFGNNFVKTILKYGKERGELNVVCDQVGSPTYAYDLAKVIVKIIESSYTVPSGFKPGIYHYTNEGVCSWYDFAKEILSLSGISCIVNPIETKDYPLPAKRPSYSIFNKSKIKSSFNITIPYWKDSLRECISRF